MALFRLSHRHRVMALAPAVAFILAACAAEAPVVAPAPPAAPARSCLVLVGLSPGVVPLCQQEARRELRGAVSKALVDSSRFGVLEMEVVAPREPTPIEARNLARRAGASLVALLRLHHLDVRTRTHHVRCYHDASAAGELLIIDVDTGVIESVARQSIHLSTRARYSTAIHARDLVLARLAEKLSRDVLGGASPTPSRAS